MIEYQSREFCRKKCYVQKQLLDNDEITNSGKEHIRKMNCGSNCMAYKLHDYIVENERVVNGEIIARALAKLYYAYLNKDGHIPHEFEQEALDLALPIISEYGGLKELLKDN